MSVVIPDEILQTSHMTASEMTQEVAILLFERNKLTLEQASELAGLDQLRFRLLLASRQVHMHYDVADLEADLRTLHEMGQL
jgi:predicted HTH domain antitoxin